MFRDRVGASSAPVGGGRVGGSYTAVGAVAVAATSGGGGVRVE